MSISSEIDRLEAAKSQLAAAITAKGVTVPEAAKLDAYPDYVASIPAGGSPRTYRVVIGTSTAGWTEDDCDYLCTGTEDDVVISQAIQSLPSGSQTLYFLSGTYTFSNTLNINKSITLMGDNRISCFSSRGFPTIAVSASGVTIRDIEIKCDNSDTSMDITGSNFLMINCEVGSVSAPISVTGYEARFLDCNLTAMIIGETGEDSNIRIDRCYINGLALYSAVELRGNNIIINDCYFNNYQTAIYNSLTSSLTNIQITNNIFDMLTVGISLSNISGLNILSNRFFDCYGYAIMLSGTNQYINVSDNYAGGKDPLEPPSGTQIQVSGEKMIVTSNNTPGTEISVSGNRVLIDNNSY